MVFVAIEIMPRPATFFLAAPTGAQSLIKNASKGNGKMPGYIFMRDISCPLRNLAQSDFCMKITMLTTQGL